MDDSAAFPRGGRPDKKAAAAVAAAEAEASASSSSSKFKNKRSHKDYSKSGGGGKEESIKTDFLFGSNNDAEDAKRKKRKISTKSSSSSSSAAGTSAHSLLPLGGGGVVVMQSSSKQRKNNNKDSQPSVVIEALGFSKLAKGTKVLGVVREVRDEYAIVSLPNLLSGYILPSSSSSSSNTTSSSSLSNWLTVGQILSVVVVKIVKEDVKKAYAGQQQQQQRRRIQVSPLPGVVNPREEEALKRKTIPMRGQILSIEDHGCLVDIGYGRKGFVKFDDVEGGNYRILDEDEEEDDDENEDEVVDDDDKKKKKKKSKEVRILQPGRLYDFFVTAEQQVNYYTLSLPSTSTLARQAVSPPATKFSTPYTLNSICPGWLVHAKVEALAKNGLCVTFLNNVFRGAIELNHLGSHFIPTTKDGADATSAWRAVFDKHQHFQARVVAIDVPTKMIRLSLAPHMLELKHYSATAAAATGTLSGEDFPVELGSIVKDCTVIRQDPGIGALLALPESYNRDPEVAFSKRTRKLDLFKNQAYLEATKPRAVYVHISKAVEAADDRTNSTAVFSKEFAPSTVHDVRILGMGNLADGFATGGCAPSILKAHVLTHSDLQPGQVYKQVPVCAQLSGGSILVQLGGSFKNMTDVKGLIPPMHLFETSNSSEFRRKLLKAKYAVDAKIDVRVLSVDAEQKKCVVTAKKSMVKAEESDIVSSYDDLNVGTEAVGFVSKVDERSVFVTFCNRVYGRVTAKSLSTDLGIEDHTETYHVGDVVKCRVVKLKKRKSLGGRRTSSVVEEDEAMDVESDGDDETAEGRSYWEVTLSLKVDEKDDKEMNDDDGDNNNKVAASQKPAQIRVKAGSILPLKSMKIVELQTGRPKKSGGFIPGYAVVSIKSKHVVDKSNQNSMISNIECKLPYDQLLDEYDPDDTKSIETFDALAERLLSVGKKINQKGLILTDPHKSNVDYSTGMGKMPIVTIRKQIIHTAEKQYTAEEMAPNDMILPDLETNLYQGAVLHGYVAQVDQRHGTFVHFLNGMSGLIPKKWGGASMQPYETVVTKIKQIDDRHRPVRIMLEPVGGKKVERGEIEGAPFKAGDKIATASVKKIQFHETVLGIPDDEEEESKLRVVIHASMKDGRETEIGYNKKQGSKEKDREIPKKHPFHGLKVGQEMSNLTVVAVKHNRGRFTVFVTDKAIHTANESSMEDKKEAPTFVEKRSELVSGMVTTAFIDKIADNNKGIHVRVSPFVQGFIPGLEISGDLRILNDLKRHVAVGTLIKCRVMDQAHWHEVRGLCPFASQHQLSLATRKSEQAENPQLFLSVMACAEDSPLHVAKPKRGDLLVGRIQKSLPQSLPPSLMIALRGGYVGRSCITELAENDDWENMPIQSAAASAAQSKTKSTDADDMEVDGDADDADKSVEEKKSEDQPEMEEAFPDGEYIECRVLKSFGKQSLVDVSLRKSRVDGDLDEDPTPGVGETAHGYVVQTNKKGCFVRLARHVEGRVTLKEICDGFLPNPEKAFPMGRLVVGKVKAVHDAPKKSKHSKDPIRVRVDLDMRESVVLEDEPKLEFEDVEINKKYKGTVARIESYGVFVQLENSNISGLVHLSECSDRFVKNLEGMYNPGDPVKILVIKKDKETKKFGFSMKASHFENDEESDDDSSVDSDEDADMVDVAAVNSDDEDGDKDLDSDDDNFASKLAAKMQEDEDDGSSSDEDSGDSDDDDDDDDDDSSGSDDDESAGKKGSKALDTDVGFEWGAGASSNQGKAGNKDDDSDDESSSDEEDEDGDDAEKSSSHKSRKKQAQRRREEREISRREVALADGTADENPETAGDFERLLAGNPNSSELWIRYMAFHLSLSDIPAARAVAEKAMERIEFRQEREKLNVWTALLTLEHKYGDKKSFSAAIERASAQNNPKQVYLRACEILEKDTTSPDSVSRADNMFSKMCKKFKSKKTVWLAHLQYLLKQHRHQEAHALSKRALLSLAEYKHAETMSRFAQLEFEFGSLERARTLFDGIVEKYTKRLDLFFVYVDKEIKFGSLESARALLQKKVEERSLSDKKMKNLFKKWYRLEEEHGTEESQEEVKASARAYVENSS